MSDPVLLSILTCPECRHETQAQMPTDSCQWFFECPNCRTVLRPKPGDCCVFCSYGTNPCPPVQLGSSCCS
ncbi:GDCCVxC domain-containing (seleno)protein [Actibacterium atlanticum]|uniref:GDCCVxC domain-containing (seleno)protein n=1 Tax=Actibacterium atlanticum TaxID=1461693 RepID=UPI0009DFC990|nr:GDCCVxC domain-containing (seleno)protein [Actibacterium atlanticum]